ncbi:MAG: sulfotransferase domain-containing protein [Alphaproteobacteria bacterium]|nr:sulfotransferase domain-containing protein [Alphaproteobacteria bacterium]HPF47274.1 sulfotransferase domain-containing protein [Emcibacteraceae bacterium]HRW30318.1 sulfotransferase domain-containing protein [Emcibacteraceae bacterium]
MAQAFPKKTRDYDGHPIINGSRWQAYKHRPGDIIVTTAYKAGTTWMQTIVANLLYQDGNFPAPVSVMSPWLDMDMMPIDELIAGLEAQTGRRSIKTHLPLDGIPYYDTAKYIYVGRDGRDVFMSFWNHHNNYSDMMKGMCTEKAQAMGKDFKVDYKDHHEFFADWIGKSWFPWENDGFPCWSHLSHVQSWWNYRHLDNILFVHFNDLLKDPEKAIRRIAKFLDIEIQEDKMPGILERISFDSMKKGFSKIMPEAEEIWKKGAKNFMNKGTNGRWRDLLTKEELDKYDRAVAKSMTSDAAHWLEHGGEI